MESKSMESLVSSADSDATMSEMSIDSDTTTSTELSVAVMNLSPKDAIKRQKLLIEISVFKSKLEGLKSNKEETMLGFNIENNLVQAEIDEINKTMDCLDKRLIYFNVELNKLLDDFKENVDMQRKQFSEFEYLTTECHNDLHRCIADVYRNRLLVSIRIEQEAIHLRSYIIKKIKYLEETKEEYSKLQSTLADEGYCLKRMIESMRTTQSMAFSEKYNHMSNIERLNTQLDKLQFDTKTNLRKLDTSINLMTTFIQQAKTEIEELDASVGNLPPTYNVEDAKVLIEHAGCGTSREAYAFNLRVYVESKGHQFDESSDEFLSNGWSCRGFLEKFSGADREGTYSLRKKRWQKRWFVFDMRSGSLSYYRRRSDDPNDPKKIGNDVSKKVTNPRDYINFKDITGVFVTHTYDHLRGKGRTFVIHTSKRTFLLSASTEQAVQAWVEAIKSKVN